MVIEILEIAGKIILAAILVALWIAPDPFGVIGKAIVRMWRFFRKTTATPN